MNRIAVFSHPLRFSELATNPKTKNIPLVRKRFQGKTEVTDYWPLLFEQLTKRNPGITKALKKFLPD